MNRKSWARDDGEWREVREMGSGGTTRRKRMGREERGRPEWRERREPQEARCPVGRAFNTGESGRICKERSKGSKLPCACLKLPSPQGPVPQTRLPTSVAKKPFGRCLPRDARPPGPGLSLALMVC